MPKILPKEALEYLSRRKIKPTKGWTDLWHGEHARYFTVAQSVYADVLNDIYNAVEDSLKEGLTLQDFKKNLTPILQAKGWWGKTQDGVQLGSPRRLEIIYDTNLRTSLSAARWERVQRHKESMPYLMYICVMDENTRDEHRQWHNMILPIDHPFWQTHFPPNGWRCRCIVRQLSAGQMQREGLKVSKDPIVKYRNWQDKSTGEVKPVPEGIAPGFDYNVGVAGLRVKAREQVANKMKNLNPQIADNAINQIVKTEDFAEFFAKPQGYYAIGVVDDLIKNTLQAQTSVCLLSDETLLKNKDHHPDLTLDEYIKINGYLKNYDMLVQDTDNSVVAIKQDEGRQYWLAVKVTRRKNEIFINTYHLTREHQIETLLKKGKRIK